MNVKELTQLVEATMKRGSPAYSTPSGAFLELLRRFASERNLVAFADACSLYASAHPNTSTFIAARVPGILCNCYFTVLPGFDYERFIQWSLENKGWQEQLIESYASPADLQKVVQSICTSVGKST